MTNTVNHRAAPGAPDGGVPPHVPLLMGRVFAQLAELFDDPALDGLRQSHARILESIAPDGSRTTDLAALLRMTKQGAGQLVTTLVERGLVEQRPDPTDGRARVLVRTGAGDAIVRRVHTSIGALEQEWAQTVGPGDYAVFRSVLEQLADLPGRGSSPR